MLQSFKHRILIMFKTVIISAILGLFSVTAYAADMQQMQVACDAGNGLACGELAARYYLLSLV